MTTAALADLATIHSGGRLGLTGSDFVDRGVPAYGAAGINGYVDRAEYEKTAAVILSSIGARCGKCFLATGSWTSLANTQVIVPDVRRVDPRFLWYQLNDERRWHRSGSAQPFIKPSDVKAHKVFLPSVEDQRRIAAILDYADAILARRQDILARLDSLAQSIFNQMFRGKPVLATVAQVAKQIRTGPFGSQLLHSEFVDDGIAVLGLDNVVGNKFRWAERRFITRVKYEQLRRYTVHPGDVLISIMGTVGRCVVVPDDIPPSINTKHICAITADDIRIDPMFLRAAFLWHPQSRAHLRRQTKGSIMDGLNMGIIKAMPIPVPPLQLQRQFADRIRQIDIVRSHCEQARIADSELFEVLRSRAFRGDL